jgi:hypothetical protein
MTRWPDWTQSEFDDVLNAPQVSAEDLAQRLGSRTAGAVGWVQSGIHAYHTGGDASPLSEMMKRRLAARAGAVVCPRCQAQF